LALCFEFSDFGVLDGFLEMGILMFEGLVLLVELADYSLEVEQHFVIFFWDFAYLVLVFLVHFVGRCLVNVFD
jgi:hypothetical protein